jgi:hypothetical protein
MNKTQISKSINSVIKNFPKIKSYGHKSLVASLKGISTVAIQTFKNVEEKNIPSTI